MNGAITAGSPDRRPERDKPEAGRPTDEAGEAFNAAFRAALADIRRIDRNTSLAIGVAALLVAGLALLWVAVLP